MKKIICASLAMTGLFFASPASYANEFYQPARINLTAPDDPAEADRDEDADHTPANQADALIDHGMGYLGIRYRRGGSSPATGLDCSGLVQNVFSKSIGLTLPRRADEMARLGQKVDKKSLMPGDLVFFNTMRRANSHVGIYVGEGRFLHAPSSGGVVRIDDMGQKYWRARFNGARRLLAKHS